MIPTSTPITGTGNRWRYGLLQAARKQHNGIVVTATINPIDERLV
jgi:hypothetical protein